MVLKRGDFIQKDDGFVTHTTEEQVLFTFLPIFSQLCWYLKQLVLRSQGNTLRHIILIAKRNNT